MSNLQNILRNTDDMDELSSSAEDAADAIDDLIEALRLGVRLVSDETGWGTTPRMDMPDLYADADEFRERAKSILARLEGAP
jgi:adenosyl cobinamide kinase/adenosyl cobinamide phosphate guanylyltransferase